MGGRDEIQSAIERYEDASARYDELMPIAHTRTPGADADPGPDEPALRAQRRDAKGARDEAWRDLKARVQALTDSKEK
jgi:hypothetical protein